MFLLLLSVSYAQEWILFNKSNSGLPDNQVHDIEIDKSGTMWFATANGLAGFDGNNWLTYDSLNSKLPSSFITALESDENNNLWIGTNKGFAVLNKNTWLVYDTSNSLLESNNITKIVCSSNVVWIGTDNGLLKYSDSEWEIYDDENSGLFVDQVHSAAVDDSSNLWIGVFEDFSFRGILIKFDGNEWDYFMLDKHELPSSFPDDLAIDRNNNVWLGTKGTTGGSLVNITSDKWEIFNRNNSPFPGGGISSLAFQDSVMWIGSSMGLISYTGSEWNIFNTDNSEIPDNILMCVETDEFGNKWMGTISSGAAVFNEGGIITTAENNRDIINSIQLMQNYPNPFNPVTTIRFSLPSAGKVSLLIYNATGQLIKSIINTDIESGTHDIGWDGSNNDGQKVSSGIYFCRLSVKSGKDNFTKVNKMVLLR